MRRFHSYGPVDKDIHFSVPRVALVDNCLHHIIGEPGKWIKLSSAAKQLAVGNIGGDGRDDLIGIWSNAVWVRYGATGQWQQITSSKPKWITTGRMAEAIQAAGSLDDPMATGEEVLDLSKNAPAGLEADTADSVQHKFMMKQPEWRSSVRMAAIQVSLFFAANRDSSGFFSSNNDRISI